MVELYEPAEALFYLWNTPISLRKRLWIMLHYVRIYSKYIFISPWCTLQSEEFLNFEIHAFDYETIRYLFMEVFVRNDYYVEAPEKPFIIDAGSNIGFTVLYYKWLFPNSTIHAYEPDPETFQLLQKNLRINKLSDVRAHNVALGNSAGKTTLYRSSEKSGSLKMSLQKDRMDDNPVEIQSQPLSDTLEEKTIDVAKVDVEGAETEILRNLAENELYPQKLLLEVHHNIRTPSNSMAEITQFLKNGHYVYSVDTGPTFSKKTNVYQDIFIRSEKPNQDSGNSKA